MINLLGCSTDNFVRLLELMNYKNEKGKKEEEIYFRYMPKKLVNKRKLFKKIKKNNSPFSILKTINYN